MKPILVTGATGKIGSEVVRLLLERGRRVRVLTRDPKKVAHHGDKVEVAVGEPTDPAALARAMEGVERAFVHSPSAEHVPLVAGHAAKGAKAAGVRHLVLNSSGTILMEPKVTIGRWHLEGEEKIKASGIPWTMLRPGNFASNTLRWAGSIKSQGAVYGPNGSGRSAPIDPRDIGAVAAAALAEDGHAGKTYVLTGPELLSTAEQVAHIGTALGKPLKFVEVPEAGARAGMLKSGMPPHMADALLELMRPGGEPLVTATVRQVTGREPRRFEHWVRDHLAAFA